MTPEEFAEWEARQRERVARARERFGQPFAYEPGATWRQRPERLLTEWLARRVEEKQRGLVGR
jgi:hypothetical protein